MQSPIEELAFTVPKHSPWILQVQWLYSHQPKRKGAFGGSGNGKKSVLADELACISADAACSSINQLCGLIVLWWVEKSSRKGGLPTSTWNLWEHRMDERNPRAIWSTGQHSRISGERSCREGRDDEGQGWASYVQFVCWSSWRFVYWHGWQVCEKDTSPLGRICYENFNRCILPSWSWSLCWTPTGPTEHNNLKFSPRLCLWAVDQKLASTGETLFRILLCSLHTRS